MKIGIYLNYGPNTRMVTEGLGRYLGELVHGFIDNNNEVTIVCPKWLKKGLDQLFDDLGVDISKVSVFTTKHIPFAWKVMSLLKKKKVRHKRFEKIKSIIRYFTQKEMRSFVRANSPLEIISLFVKAILYLTIGLCALPLLITLGLAFLLLVYLKKVLRKLIRKIKPQINSLVLMNTMMDSVADELIEIVNSRKNIDIWYAPALFWPEVSRIQKTTVINIPDIETEQFSTGFAAFDGLAFQTNMLRKTISEGKYFITYCEYIKRSLIDEQLAGMGKCAYTITHINNDMSKYITINPEVAQQMHSEKDLSAEFARVIVDGILSNGIGSLKISSMKYIFFASQVRANKNILTLIRAFNELVHERFMRLKIVFTGKIYDNTELKEYIDENDLQNDIIVCNNVSSQQLAALYKCATLIVNPTLYEGGFPFTFGEGMSVGTPSIMSDIPQVSEVFIPASLQEAMFDPYDYLALADKIQWALDHVDDLYELELPLYNELKQRTPGVVAREYENVFRHIINISESDAS